jgi:hypothetical protein
MVDKEKEMEKKVEERVTEGVSSGVAKLIKGAVALAVMVVVFKLVWGWVAADLFPGAVAEGLITASLSWLAALKFAVLAIVVSGAHQGLRDAIDRK